eukprot:6601-Heterococcus_DN1.PRE.4
METATTIGKIIKKIFDVANTVTLNDADGNALAIRVRALEGALVERAIVSQDAYHMVVHVLERIAKFLETLGADDNKETFKTHNDHLSNLVRDTYHLRAHATEQRTGIAVAVAIDDCATCKPVPLPTAPTAPYASTLSPSFGVCTATQTRQQCLQLVQALFQNDTSQVKAALIEQAIGKTASDLDATLTVIKRYPNDTDMQMWCCKVIHKCATEDTTCKQQLIDRGRYKFILNALELHLEAPHVIISGCEALGVIAMHNCTNRCILRCANAETLIKTAMTKHRTAEALIASANEALRHISPHKLSKTAGSSNRAECMKLMKLAYTQAQKQGQQALTCQRLQQLNAIIIDMATYFNDSEIQTLACKAIHVIAQKNPQAGDYLGREGACEAVIAVIMKHDTVELVARCGWCAVLALTCCKAADILAVGDDNIKRLYEG